MYNLEIIVIKKLTQYNAYIGFMQYFNKTFIGFLNNHDKIYLLTKYIGLYHGVKNLRRNLLGQSDDSLQQNVYKKHL